MESAVRPKVGLETSQISDFAYQKAIKKSISKQMSKETKEEELERLAKQELLKEAKRGAERSKTMGTQGWLKPKLPTTNKRFLHRTLASAAFDLKRPKRLNNANDQSSDRRPDSAETSDKKRRHEDQARSRSPQGKRTEASSGSRDAKNRKR